MISEAGPWSLPESWVWTTMSEVAEIAGGATPRTEHPENFASPGIPWITPADLSGYKAKLISHGSRDISEKGLASSSARLLPAGTVLFSSRAPIGYVAIAANPVTTNQGFKSFILSKRILPDYVYYWLIRAKDLLSEFASGTTFLEISGKRAQYVPLPVAPLKEQRRIVEGIESLLPKLDAAVAALERVRANLKRYRASVLKSAVEGRLVPTEAELARKEGRDYEPASVLLNRILVERRRRWEESELARMTTTGKPPKDDRWKSKYKEPVAPSTSALPQLPEGWCWATVDQLICEPLSNGRSVPTDPGGFPVLRLTALKGNTIDLSERKGGAWTLEAAVPFLVTRGDFLVARGNGSIRLVGWGGLVDCEPDPVAFPDTLIRVRIAERSISPKLFAHIWNSRCVRDQVEHKAKTTAGIHKVNQTDLSRCVLPVPPKREQERILSELERVISAAISTDQTLEATQARCTRLRQSVLKWAFDGKLADQDPNDEPAAVLLERIRAERAAAGPPRKSRKSATHEAEATN